ncbi:hypothetical protein [Actinomadura sp. HBU206391]|uniref:hypothetical protein n=1 Tax=Actinomadura sp. HBU206391 TaxID=2731692 RepID=UPI00164FD624|nr:hypothetical protein [Actinomadura sp. HBU206391]MBC6456560.1 hypothetical protein [Actinomadura sp. HBU206391]
MVAPLPDAASRSVRPRRAVLTVILALVLVVGGCGVTGAWWFGSFTDDGRFERVDACTLLPPGALPRLVRDPVPDRDGESHPPRTAIGWGGGDLTAVCKWSSSVAGRDAPFRTVRLYAETRTADPPYESAPERARELFAGWRSRAVPGADVRDEPGLAEEGFSLVDQMSILVVFARIDVYDVHVKFRTSNLLVDLSARTHTRPSAELRARLVAVAHQVAAGMR